MFVIGHLVCSPTQYYFKQWQILLVVIRKSCIWWFAWYWRGFKLRKLVTKDWIHVFPGLISGRDRNLVCLECGHNFSLRAWKISIQKTTRSRKFSRVLLSRVEIFSKLEKMLFRKASQVFFKSWLYLFGVLVGKF